MSNFDKKEFGKNIRKFRKSKGLSQENLAMAIHKTPATIARYENGEITPNAEQIYLICNELGIYEYELFNGTKKINNIENNINPFNTDTLYLYYIAYYPKSKRYGKGKFRLKLVPSIRKCILSKKDIDFTDELLDKLKITNSEKESLNKHDILYLDITDTYAFENE